jgi:calcineurin-like phosphoesterase family protein
MIWFTSDLHIGHKNITGKSVSKWKSGYRNFNSVTEMNDTIINNINNYVKWDDVIYFLGDFAFVDVKKIQDSRHRINCQTIHFLYGNHDEDIRNDQKLQGIFTSIKDVDFITVNSQNYFLSHYSHRVWPASHRGTIHLYGHSHGSIPDFGKSMDVGIDVAYRLLGEYRPFSITEIIDIMSKKEVSELDHHVFKNPK